MANSVVIQTLVDGPRNTVIKVDGILDTSDVPLSTLIDPALLSPCDVNGATATKLRINKITYDIEDTLAVNLLWDATSDVRIGQFIGRGELCAKKFGGLTDNSGAGRTGKILYSTQGWAASAILSFTIVIELVKS